MTEFVDARQSETMIFETCDHDHYNRSIRPGQRIMITEGEQSIVFDRPQLVRALAFLEMQKDESDRAGWCATCGQRVELEAAK